METTEQTEPQFRSLGALLAFEYRTNGAEHLNRVLAALVEASETRREFVQEAAAELKAIGVPIADEVLEAAMQCPSMTDLRFCAYTQPPYTDNAVANEANIKMWIWGKERRANKKRERCKELLQQAGIDPGWLNGPTRQ